jgi:hypothetical protein
MASNAALLHQIVYGYVNVWRKTYQGIQAANLIYPAIRLGLNMLAVTNIVAAMDDMVNRIWKELHDICNEIVHRTCEDILDAELFRRQETLADMVDHSSQREIVSFFVNMMRQLSSSAYLDPGTDSKEFKEYVDGQLMEPFDRVKATMREVIWRIQTRNMLLYNNWVH